ncbi:hypothetical protein D3C76_1039750 [compost metagenome]
MLATLQAHLIRVVPARVPTPALDAHDGAVRPGKLAVQLQTDLSAQFQTGRVASQNEAMDQPRLFARAVCPHPPLVAVILGVDTTKQRHRAARHLGAVRLAAVAQLLPIQFFALVFLPYLTKRGVDEGLELAPVLTDLDPLGRDICPGGEGRIDGPDMESHRARRQGQLLLGVEPLH